MRTSWKRGRGQLSRRAASDAAPACRVTWHAKAVRAARMAQEMTTPGRKGILCC